MHIDRTRLLLTAALAICGGALVACTAPADPVEADPVEVETVEQALPVAEGGGGCSLTTTTSYSTSSILPATVCSGAMSATELQRRAGAVFSYLVGGADPTIQYPCTGGGSLNLASLNYIRTALDYGNESAKVKNCFFTTTANNCGSNIKATHHILTYSGASLSTVNALKNLAATVDACWYGAGTWAQPARPNNVQNYEGPGSNNFGEDCTNKDAYVRTTTKTTKDCDGFVVSTTKSYSVGCFRVDPGPATLTSNLYLVGNNNTASSVDANTGAATPLSYSYSNSWTYNPTGPAGGTPCVSKQALASMGMNVDWWNTNQYVNNFIQASGSYRRCITQQ